MMTSETPHWKEWRAECLETCDFGLAWFFFFFFTNLTLDNPVAFIVLLNGWSLFGVSLPLQWGVAMVALPSFLPTVLQGRRTVNSACFLLYLIQWFPSCKRAMKNIEIFKVSNITLIIA